MLVGVPLGYITQSKILKVWNNIDKRITKYHVEAADNAKFLGAIEKTSHSIYLEDPSELKGELTRNTLMVNGPVI